jgi:hypothetical protein
MNCDAISYRIVTKHTVLSVGLHAKRHRVGRRLCVGEIRDMRTFSARKILFGVLFGTSGEGQPVYVCLMLHTGKAMQRR